MEIIYNIKNLRISKTIFFLLFENNVKPFTITIVIKMNLTIRLIIFAKYYLCCFFKVQVLSLVYSLVWQHSIVLRKLSLFSQRVKSKLYGYILKIWNTYNLVKRSTGLLAHQYFNLFRTKFKMCTCSCTLGKSKYHSVWLEEMRNSCTSVFPNTWAWEQQEWNKIQKQMKKVGREAWVIKEVKRARKK